MGDLSTTVIDAVATYRLSRLVARDTMPLVAKAREAWWRAHPIQGTEIPVEEVASPAAHRVTGIQATESAGQRPRKIMWWTPGILGLGVSHEGMATLSFDKENWIISDETALGELIECPYCHSAYIGILVVVLRRCVPKLWDPIAKALAFSAAAGLMTGLE